MTKKQMGLWALAVFEAWWDDPDPVLLETYFWLASGGKLTSMPAFGLRIPSLQAANAVAHALS